MLRTINLFFLSLLFLISGTTSAQFPDFRHYVIDVNKAPTRGFDFLPSFFPTEDGAFFYDFDAEINPLYYFNGSQLDTSLFNIGANGAITGVYRNGYFLYTDDSEGDGAGFLLTINGGYNTIRLPVSYVQQKHTFPDGRSLFTDGFRLYAIDDATASIVPLGDDVRVSCCAEAVLGGNFIFSDGSNTMITDGTVAGTVELFEGAPRFGSGYEVFDNHLFFITSGGELIVSDGTVVGTRPMDFSALPTDQRPVNPESLWSTSNYLLFNANNETSGLGVWSSDGTIAGTRRLASMTGRSLVVNDSLLVFRGGAAQDGLWLSDGTPESARNIFDYSDRDVENPDWEVIHLATLADGTLYFRTTEAFESPVWSLSPDGSLKEIFSCPTNTCNQYVFTTTNQVFIALREGQQGLYAHTPGTPSFTRLADIERPGGSAPLDKGFLIQGGEDFFGNSTYTIVHYDGVTTTYPFRIGMNLNETLSDGSSLSVTQAGDSLYGITWDESAGESIFSMNLYDGKINVIQDLSQSTQDANHIGLYAGEGAAFFRVNDTIFGTDGTNYYEEIPELNWPFSISTIPGNPRNLFYQPNTRTAWHFSSGRAGGTNQLPGSDLSLTSNVTSFKDDFYCLESGRLNDSPQLRVVRIDGETGQRTIIKSISPPALTLQNFQDITIASSGNHLYFPFPVSGAWKVWRSDGTSEGTEFFGSTVPNSLVGAPFSFKSGDGFVAYEAKVNVSNLVLGTFIIREGDEKALRLPDYSLRDDPGPVRVGGGIAFATSAGVSFLPDDAAVPLLRVEEPGRNTSGVTRVDASRIVYISSVGEDARLWRYDFDLNEKTELLDALAGGVSPEGYNLMDSLVLISRKWQGESLFFDELRLVNLNTAESVIATPGTGLQQIAKIVREGDRFLYYNIGEIYGRELYVIDFSGERPVATENPIDQPVLNFAIYPNPSNGRLQLNLPSGGQYVYEVFDATGRQLTSGRILNESPAVNLTNLGNGLYFVRVTDLTYRRSATKKILLAGGR